MNARLNSLCVAALLALGASATQAQTSVTLYGTVGMELVRATGTTTGNLNKLDDSRVTNSRLGFKGSEDLGSGLYGVFGLESRFKPDTGTTNSTFWTAGSYVGLSSAKLGTLTFGRQWNVNDDFLANYFVFDGYSAFSFAEFDYISDLVNNSVKYVSPTWGGLTIRGLVAAGEGTTGKTEELAADYKIGGLSIGASYHYHKGLNDEANKLASGGISYTFGDFRPHVGYAVSDSKASEEASLPGPMLKAKAWDVGLQWAPSALWTFDFDYVKRDQEDTENDSHFWRVQGVYFLSKRTQLFANVVALKNKGDATMAFYGDVNPGQNQNVYSLGLRHSF